MGRDESSTEKPRPGKEVNFAVMRALPRSRPNEEGRETTTCQQEAPARETTSVVGTLTASLSFAGLCCRHRQSQP